MGDGGDVDLNAALAPPGGGRYHAYDRDETVGALLMSEQ